MDIASRKIVDHGNQQKVLDLLVKGTSKGSSRCSQIKALQGKYTVVVEFVLT